MGEGGTVSVVCMAVWFNFLSLFLLEIWLLLFHSGDAVFAVGRPTVHRGTKSAVGVQRKSLYQLGHLQRVPALPFPQRLHVSFPVSSHRSNGQHS